MRRGGIAALLFLTGCATTVTAPLPTSPPPMPPPQPLVPVFFVNGVIRDPVRTSPAAFALVTVTPATTACTPVGESARVFANERGEYEAAIPTVVDTDPVACVIIEATSGGATGQATANATSRVTSNIQLDPIPPMTPAAGEMLLREFVALLNGGASDEVLLSTYVYGGPEALRTAREDYQSLLGSSITMTLTDDREFSSSHQRVRAELRGSKGGPLSVDAYQDYTRSLHGPLVDYSLRSRYWIASFSRLIMSGDAERLARLLTADDLDVPVEEARRVLDKYKPDFEVRGGAYELTAVDERRHTLTYRVTWRGEGREESADVTLRYGDGLLGLVE